MSPQHQPPSPGILIRNVSSQPTFDSYTEAGNHHTQAVSLTSEGGGESYFKKKKGESQSEVTLSQTWL